METSHKFHVAMCQNALTIKDKKFFKVVSNIFNLKVILAQTNLNILFTHYFQYKREKNGQNQTSLGKNKHI